MSLFPCKSCIEKTGTGCCGTYPLMTYEEAAKIMYKYGDILAKDNMSLNSITNNGVIFHKPEDIKGNELVLENVVCPFLDKKEKRCVIYEDRPKLCREFGATVGYCPYKGQTEVTEIKPLRKIDPNSLLDENREFINEYFQPYKMMKEMDYKKADKMMSKKEFQHMLIVSNYIGHLAIHSKFFNADKEYGFITEKDGKASPYRRTNLKLEFPFTPLGKLYNSMQRKILLINIRFLQPFEKKLNNALQGLKDTNDAPPEKLLLLALFYLKTYQANFKGKDKQYSGFINSNELYEIEKKLLSDLGYQSLIKAMMDEEIKEIYTLAERMYKIIQNLR